MKSRHLAYAMFVGSMLFGVFALGVYAQKSPSKSKNLRARRAAEPEVFSKHALAPALPVNADPLAEDRMEAEQEIPWTVQVDWTLKLDPQTRELYERAASAIQGLEAIPEARVHFFSAVQNPPTIAIKGWGSLLRSVEPVDGGYIATIDVHPRLISTMGKITAIGSDYSERYFIDVDDNVHYIESLDPQGMAGQEPLYYTSG